MLINGENKHCIDPSDRGFQYGDGLFETIEVFNKHPVFLERHLQRLELGCQKLRIPFPDNKTLREEIHSLTQQSSRAVLKIIITRGVGGRGYRQPDPINATRALSLHPFPQYPDCWSKDGINVRFCQSRLGHNDLLAGIKHLNRLEQVLARAEWNSNEIQEGLMYDIDDNIVEGTMSNLFYVKGNRLYTPYINRCGVAGIIRGIIIELGQRHQLPVQPIRVTKETLLTADELFLTNSIIGVWPVKQMDNKSFSVGQLSRQFCKWFNEFKEQDIAGG